MKTCTKCKLEQPLENFSKSKATKDGHQYHCKKCQKERIQQNQKHVNELTRKRYAQNPQKGILRSQAYYQLNKDKIRAKVREEYHANLEEQHAYRKQLYDAKKEEYRAAARLKRQNNLEHYRKYMVEWRRKKLKTDIKYRTAARLRTRLRNLLNKFINTKVEKPNSITEILGCSMADFLKHLESQFTEGMNWQEYMTQKIHIDHIIPCCAFDLSKLEEQKKCFNYTNLRPLWSTENQSKNGSDRKLSIQKNIQYPKKN